MKKDKIYCIHCGKENDKNIDICKYCNKDMKIKDHDIYEILVGESWDKAKGNILKKIYDMVFGFIDKYFYGTIFTLTIIGTFFGVNAYLKNNEIYETTNKRELINEEEFILGCWKGSIELDENNYKEWFYNIEGNGYYKLYTTDINLSYNEVNVIEDEAEFFLNKSDNSYYIDTYDIYGLVKFEDRDNFTVTEELDKTFEYKSTRITCDKMPTGETYKSPLIEEKLGTNYKYNYQKRNSKDIHVN